MTLIKFEPLREIESFHERLQRYFEDFPSMGFNLQDNFFPRIDISEEKGKINVTAEIPGVKKEEIKITLQDNILTIQGEKKKEEVNNETNFFRSERVFGSFKRSFTLPVEVDSDSVNATFDNGTLVIEMKQVMPQQKAEKIIELK